MSEFYILDKDHNLIPVDVLTWGKWFDTPDRIVKQEMINDVRVSTVFLGIDHGFGWLTGYKDSVPICFETMIFGGEHDQYQDRCATWKEAEAMHAKAAALVRKSQFKLHRRA